MIENIIEDGLNDFFYHHLCKLGESWKLPIHFVGGIAFTFKDVVEELCRGYEFTLGKIIRHPMEGLIDYYKSYDGFEKTGKVKAIGSIEIDYYKGYDGQEKAGKIKSIKGNTQYIYATT